MSIAGRCGEKGGCVGRDSLDGARVVEHRAYIINLPARKRPLEVYRATFFHVDHETLSVF